MKKLIKVLLAIVLTGAALYLFVLFAPVKAVERLRNLWIETAMTTGEHQWLATYLFPASLIDDVMSRQVNPEVISNPGLIDIPSSGNNNTDPLSTPAVNSEPAAVYDELGNKIIVDDKDQDIRIVEVKTSEYVGHLMFVKDPKRIVVATTDKKDVRGAFVKDLAAQVDGIAAINANAFVDDDGLGSGGQIIGWTVANGEEWGRITKRGTYTSMGFDYDGKLIVGNISNFSKYNIKELVQYQPAMIVDGKQLFSGSGGWGIHPRTAIGQKSDGTVILAVIDGRQPGYSIGTTIGELADLMFAYGCVNAAACDGGSSSVLYYDGDIIGIPSTPRKETGRYLPNAIVVTKK
ncbi:MAG: phosphodiester glycosidase family protein [Oscillospiraceae bacterium]|jgi:exopolysaccharide biosynthesis protein|nr:phosphodiester glycosidase family protein [Oscillospiraceae bacterium]